MRQCEMKQTAPLRVLPFSSENLRGVLPPPQMAPRDCPLCQLIGNGGSKMVKGGTLEYDTIPAAAEHLKYFMRLGEQVETTWLNICPECDRLYYCEASSEFLIPGSEEYERVAPISPEAVSRLSEVARAQATGKAEIHAHTDGTWCIVRDANKLRQSMKRDRREEIPCPASEGGKETENVTAPITNRPSNVISPVEQTQAALPRHGRSHPKRSRPDRSRVCAGHLLVQEILDAAGQPVAGNTLSLQEMERAVKEGRVLQVSYWSHFGEGEASFHFATDVGIDSDGRVHATYFVFPRPIPLSLRRESESDWEKANDVFAAFGINDT